MLHWFSSLFGGKYVFGLLIYALLFKLLFLPFSIKQQKNQIKMAQLAPKIELIKAKYKGRTDQPSLQKQQQEIMDLQQKEGYSPLSGCLPLLLQFPIIIFLYNVIRGPLSYICKLSAEEITKIKDILGSTAPDEIKLVGEIAASGGAGLGQFADKLASLPDFTLFGLDLSATPNFKEALPLVFIPVVAAALTWLSMFLTRKWNGNTNPAQDAQSNASMKMMDLMMPLMTLFFAFNFSGMLGIYWIYQSALGILQSFILSKVMPLPKFTDEELREMKRREKAQERAQRSVAKERPTYRSLHYIDADDADTLPEYKSENGTKETKTSNIDIPEIKD